MIAKNGLSWEAPPAKMIAAPPRTRRPRGTALARPCTPGCPPIRGVIVLTVKLFGETLKAPRTLAVWHG
ncbi:hypothetical protein DKG34_05405 [Streptomyces sp. NWU49]|uniref:Transposase n=1 Tax=Streptomyces viridosporus T7A TaxID=665577 RepID=A0ABX6ALL7_STRVD|nr:hypothetical protein DKG34_05405 [Streptomyces sp. NWU49]QEU87923.1 hypothetical protein CP969_26970 [Streptomyces viridosporus T7A]